MSLAENKNYVYGFVGIILGIVFLMAIADSNNLQTSVQPAVNESINIAAARIDANGVSNATNFSLVHNQGVTSQSPISNFLLTNGSGTVISAAGNYTFDSTYGNLSLLNSTFWVSGGGKANQTLATYNYKDANYVEDSASRSIIPLIVILGAIFIVVFTIRYSGINEGKVFKLRR